MKILVSIKNKDNPAIKETLKVHTGDVFGEINKMFDTQVNIGLKEDFGEQYGEFISIKDLNPSMTLEQVSITLTAIENTLKKSFNVQDFLIKIVSD